MIRRPRPSPTPDTRSSLIACRTMLVTRRQFLVRAAGGSLALLFATTTAGNPATTTTTDPWPILDATLRHLLPTEPDSPGAAEINALGYLRFVVDDRYIAVDERQFITRGAQWLEQIAVERHGASFTALDATAREAVLQSIVRSSAGENWVATLLTYLFEALLTAPAYGGNPDGIGWKWLQYTPGYPLPQAGNRYMELPL